MQGKPLLAQEKRLISQALENKFGYYLLQIGIISEQSLLQQSRISNKVFIDPYKSPPLQEHEHAIVADYNFLPIGTEKADLILMPHSLESVEDPHYLLRQLDKALMPEGYMVITGFNPAGCKAVKAKYLSKKSAFSQVRFRRARQIKEWLKVLGYEVQEVTYTQVMCLSNSEKYRTWGRFVEMLEGALQKFGFEFGNIYCIVAKKKVDAPTMVGLKWQLPSWKTAKGGSVASQGFKSNRSRQDKSVD